MRNCLSCRHLNRPILECRPCYSVEVLPPLPGYEPELCLSEKARDMIEHIRASKWMLGSSSA